MYAGTDTRNVYHDGWDVSIETASPKKQQKTIDDITQNSIEKTRRVNERMTRGQYKSPI